MDLPGDTELIPLGDALPPMTRGDARNELLAVLGEKLMRGPVL